jgi:hypothetical protein
MAVVAQRPWYWQHKLIIRLNFKEKWYKTDNIQSSNNSISNTINSITNVNASIFETQQSR